MALRNYSNTCTTGNLSAAVGTGDLVLPIAPGWTGLPSFPFYVIVDRDLLTEETMLATGGNSTALIVTRGYDVGGAAFAHGIGAKVQHAVLAEFFNKADAHVEASTNVHGLSGGSAVVGTTSSQTLTNKAINSSILSLNHSTSPAASQAMLVTADAVTGRDGFVWDKTVAATGKAFKVRASSVDRFTVDADGKTVFNSATASDKVVSIQQSATERAFFKADGQLELALQANLTATDRMLIRTQNTQNALNIKDSGGFNIFTVGGSGNLDAFSVSTFAGVTVGTNLTVAGTAAVTGTSTLTGDVTLPLPASATTPRLTVNGRTGTALWTGKNQAGTTTSRIDETGYCEHAHRLNIFNNSSPVTASVAATTDVPGPISGQIVWLNSTNSWMRYNGSAWISAETPRGIIGGRIITGTNTLAAAIAGTETKPTNMDSTFLSLEKNRRYRVHVRFKAGASGATSTFLIKLKEDTTTAGTTGNQIREYVLIDAADVETRDFFGEYETGGSDVSRAFKITAARITGADTLDIKGGGTGTTSPVGIWVEDMGPAAKLTATAS